MRLLSLMFILGLLVSCGTKSDNSNVYIIDDFSHKTDLSGSQILQDNYNQVGPIYIYDDYLLLKLYNSDTLFNVYDISTLRHLGDLGVRGKGANEWKTIVTSDQHLVNDNVCFYVNDLLRGILCEVNITKSLEGGSPYPYVDKIVNISADRFPFNQLIYINDTLIIGNGGFEEIDPVRLKSYNPETQKIRKTELFPAIKNGNLLDATGTYQVYSNLLEKHPNKDLIVSSMRMFNRIDIFNSDLELVRTIASGNRKSWEDNYLDVTKTNYEELDFEEYRDGYNSVFAGEKYIFADLEKRQNDQSVINVFDWEGNGICQLKLNEDIFSFTIDEKRNKLYVVDMENEKIMKYDLNGVLP